jgi:hypothetical protein
LANATNAEEKSVKLVAAAPDGMIFDENGTLYLLI